MILITQLLRLKLTKDLLRTHRENENDLLLSMRILSDHRMVCGTALLFHIAGIFPMVVTLWSVGCVCVLSCN